MIKNPQANRVVAFDRENKPIITHPANWKVTFSGNLVELRYKSNKRTYQLDRDPLCLLVIDETEVVNKGSTAGRIALTGLAGAMLHKGSFVGSALLDLSLRGANKNRIFKIWIMFNDHTSIVFNCSGETLEQLNQLLPSAVISEKGKRRALELMDRSDRMIADGERVLVEIKEDIRQLEEALQNAQSGADSAPSFPERDAARDKVRQIKQALEDTHGLFCSVRFGVIFDQHTKKKGQPKYGGSGNKIILWGGGSFVGIFFLLALIVEPQQTVSPNKATDEPKNSNHKTAEPTHVLKVPNAGNLAREPEIVGSTREDPGQVARPVETEGVEPSASKNKDVAAVRVDLITEYSRALRRSTDPDLLRTEQETWNSTVANNCIEESCLLDAYRKRIEKLKRVRSSSLNIRG